MIFPSLTIAQRELGDVDPDVEIAELVRHPAPLLHVHCEPAQARCLGSGGLLLAGLLVDLSRRDLGLCDGLPPLHGEVFLTQGLELWMLRVQRSQVGIDLSSFRRLLDDLLRLEQRQLAVKVAAERGGLCAPAMGVTHVFQKGEAQSDLGIGTGSARPTRAASRRRRKLKGGGIETPLVRAAKLGDCQLRGRGKAGRRRPDRLVLPRCIERQERGALLTIARRELVACREPFGELGSEADGAARCWCSRLCGLCGLLRGSSRRRGLRSNRQYSEQAYGHSQNRGQERQAARQHASPPLCAAQAIGVAWRRRDGRPGTRARRCAPVAAVLHP